MSLALSLTIHILGVVFWIGGLIAMSRVMVVQAKNKGPVREVLSVLEGKFHIFAVLGLILALGSGLYQLSQWGMETFRHTRWMHHKLTLLLVLLFVHGMLFTTHKKWAKLGPDAELSRGRASGLHGAVGLLLIAIVAVVFFGRYGAR
jgi:uncharacterized membrane protein